MIGSVDAFLGSSVDVLNGLAYLRTDALHEDINIPLKIKIGGSPSPGINVTIYFPFTLIKHMNIQDVSKSLHWNPFVLKRQRLVQQKRSNE